MQDSIFINAALHTGVICCWRGVSLDALLCVINKLLSAPAHLHEQKKKKSLAYIYTL